MSLTPMLSFVLGAFIGSFLGGIALRAAIAAFKVPRHYDLGYAARTVFYPLLTGGIIAFLATWGAQAALGKQAWIFWAGTLCQWIVFTLSLSSAIRHDLDLPPNVARKLTGVTAGSMLVVLGGIAVLAHLYLK